MKCSMGNDMCQIKFYLTISVILVLLSLFGFSWGRSLFHLCGFTLQTDVVGQFGDFVGGVVGTIVSVVLLYFTFKTQHTDVENKNKMYKEESVNKLFFHMLDLYNDTLNRYVVNDGETLNLKGKEALHYQYEQLYEDFQVDDNADINVIRKKAKATFQVFYANTQDISPIFFRTVYSLLKILDIDDQDTERERIRLMKILRAQLSNTELIMLRYNAMTRMGKKSYELINKFNIMKHLFPMDLLEYKPWSKKMTLEERTFTNQLLMIVKQNIKKVLRENSNIESYSNNIMCYNTHVSINAAKTELKVCLFIKNGIIPNSHSLVKGIQELSSNERMSLLHQFIVDFFISRIQKADEYRNIKIEDVNEANSGKWTVKVSTKNGKPFDHDSSRDFL